jgi:hypothetical protein
VLAALSPLSGLIANAMKHLARSDFHTVVTAAGVSVTFKPTKSTYSFFRFAETGALSLAGIQHAGRDTDDYPSDEVQDMALQIASGHASVHGQRSIRSAHAGQGRKVDGDHSRAARSPLRRLVTKSTSINGQKSRRVSCSENPKEMGQIMIENHR